jgi:hypothetical protein
MTERISMVLPELNPEVQASNKEKKNSWLKSGFDHIASTKNGTLTREWTVSDFSDQIKYLKTNYDPDFYFRTILQDSGMCHTFAEKLGASPTEYFENSYKHEECPEMTQEEYLKKDFWKSLAIDSRNADILKGAPNDFILETLKVYSKEISRIRIESLEVIEKLRQDFIPNFKKFSEKNNLEINWEEIRQRFDTLSYDLFDQYYADQRSASGDYDKNSHTARVEISPFSRVSPAILEHEHLHAISGRKNDMNLIFFDFMPSGLQFSLNHSIPRLGASFARSDSHPERFRWLNEAITEQINVEMMEDNPNKEDFVGLDYSYPYERILFDAILKGGDKQIAARSFYQAYFESDTGKPEDLKQRQKLYQEISEAYGSPRFFIELDDMIKSKGLKKSLEIFKLSGATAVHKWWQEESIDKK